MKKCWSSRVPQSVSCLYSSVQVSGEGNPKSHRALGRCQSGRSQLQTCRCRQSVCPFCPFCPRCGSVISVGILKSFRRACNLKSENIWKHLKTRQNTQNASKCQEVLENFGELSNLEHCLAQRSVSWLCTPIEQWLVLRVQIPFARHSQ